ncbi:MAG: phosphoenolpyruvate carboxylase [Calditrichaceae bacterium]|nr:phosphoenolpyruvate carboxylase [Calditrichaceae bacterium]
MNDTSLVIKEFEKTVKNKFDVYNSLFLNLPFKGISNIGVLIPLMQRHCREGLEAGSDPIEILDSFFNIHANLKSENEKIDFMFRIIQYIERQIVLYDSVEDAGFPEIKKYIDDLSLKDYLHLSENKNKSKVVLEKLNSFSTRVVFTAHPTQFYTHAVLDIISRLRTYIVFNDINKIDITLQQLGLTSLINSKKPTPLDEAKNVIYYLRNVYYNAIGQLYSDIRQNVSSNRFENPKIIQLGFWPGGDRDGNPYVTSDITIRVVDELRMTLMKCYYQDMKELERKLTFRFIEEIIADLRAKIYKTMFDSNELITYNKILDPVLQIRNLLIDKYNSLYLDELDRFIDKVKIFKTHFAILDIRQNHNIHKQIIESILKKEGYVKNTLNELDTSELLSILFNQTFEISNDQFNDKVLSDTIVLIKQLKTIQKKNGEEGCNRYIISNSEDIFSIVFTYCLLKWIAWDEEPITFDIIPLFESMEAMGNAENIMQTLFEIPQYRTHLEQRGNEQTIMLGFSDGTKDGGYLQANWSIFKTKEKLSLLCKEYNIKVIFFDGRGGPPARGGGKAHRFYASQTDRIANHAIQLTIQGQTITSKYGTTEHFINNCEQLITAGLSHSLFENENIISEEYRDIIEQLANISYKKYQALKNHKMFIAYLENKSTLKYYGQTNIGSRPDKRGNKRKLDLKDLRAIPFVGSWSQLKQNVPGYFGMGTAIKNLMDDNKLDSMKRLFIEVPFFKALILNSMMSLSKCYFNLTRYIAKDENYEEFWNILHDEYRLTKEMVLKISGYKSLMEEEMVAKHSIAIREKIVLPLLTIQQYALQKIEKNNSNKSVYEKIVRRALYGNINASRNSA